MTREHYVGYWFWVNICPTVSNSLPPSLGLVPETKTNCEEPQSGQGLRLPFGRSLCMPCKSRWLSRGDNCQRQKIMHSSKKKQGVVGSRQLVPGEPGLGTTKESCILASSEPKAEPWIVILLFIGVLDTIFCQLYVINTCFHSVIYLFTLLMVSVLWWTKVLNFNVVKIYQSFPLLVFVCPV